MEQYKEARKIIKQLLIDQFGKNAGCRYYNDKLVSCRRMKWYGGLGDKISMKQREKILGKVRNKLHQAGIDFIEFKHKRIKCAYGRYCAFVLKMPYN